MSCAKAQGFLAKHKSLVKVQVDAKKTRLGRDAALKLARSAATIIVAKGRSTLVFDMEKSSPDDETLLSAILGPTGNLRAPSIRRGDTLLVGFNEATYRESL